MGVSAPSDSRFLLQGLQLKHRFVDFTARLGANVPLRRRGQGRAEPALWRLIRRPEVASVFWGTGQTLDFRRGFEASQCFPCLFLLQSLSFFVSFFPPTSQAVSILAKRRAGSASQPSRSPSLGEGLFPGSARAPPSPSRLPGAGRGDRESPPPLLGAEAAVPPPSCACERSSGRR